MINEFLCTGVDIGRRWSGGCGGVLAGERRVSMWILSESRAGGSHGGGWWSRGGSVRAATGRCRACTRAPVQPVQHLVLRPKLAGFLFLLLFSPHLLLLHQPPDPTHPPRTRIASRASCSGASRTRHATMRRCMRRRTDNLSFFRPVPSDADGVAGAALRFLLLSMARTRHGFGGCAGKRWKQSMFGGCRQAGRFEQSNGAKERLLEISSRSLQSLLAAFNSTAEAC